MVENPVSVRAARRRAGRRRLPALALLALLAALAAPGPAHAAPPRPTVTFDGGFQPATFPLSGTGLAGATIKVKEGATLIGTTTVGSGGAWNLTTTVPLPNGEHALLVTQTSGGEESPPAEVNLWVRTAPVNVTKPTAPTATTATPYATLRLTRTIGIWSGTPTSYAYQWIRCDANGITHCADVPGETGTTYEMLVSDAGHAFRVRMTAANAVGTSAPVTSPAGAAVVAQVPINTVPPGPPTSSGPEPLVGVRLLRQLGTWTVSPTSYSYQWVRCDADGSTGCADIPGETATTYVPVTGDYGSTFRVRVTATNAVGPASALSAPTAPLVPRAPSFADAELPAPTTSTAVPTLGVRLVRAVGHWLPAATSYTYQWMRCGPDGILGCEDLPGETAVTYTPTASDVGQTLRVWVTATNAVGSSAPMASEPTAVVVRPVPVNLTPPAAPTTTEPAPSVGARLLRTLGSWSGAPTSYTYQWVRCDGDGTTGCADVPGETGTSYLPVAADVGKAFRVKVTAVNAGGSSSPATSAATAPVEGHVSVNVVAPAAPTTAAPAPTVGVKLVRTLGSWTLMPITYAYQWQRCDGPDPSDCDDVPGQTGTGYVPVAGDVGFTFRVAVTANNGVGPSLPALSAATAPVGPGA